jgi:hypothetical protein
LNVTVQVWINSVPTPLFCTVNFTAENQAFKCADTTDVVRVNAGDALTISMLSSTPVQPPLNSGLKINVAVEKQ